MEMLDDPKYYINREFSALAFNERVLHLAKDPNVPLLERMRFLCICSGNLDEFFEIRFAGLKEKISLSSRKAMVDGTPLDEIITQLSKKTHQLCDELYSIFNEQLLPALKKEGIYFLSQEDWTEDIHLWATHYFKKEVLPIASPIALDLAHPFPRLFNKSFNFIISFLKGKDAFDRSISYAVVHPPRSSPRVIRLPSELCTDGGHYFVYLSSIIQVHAHRFFPGMEINGCYPFRLTRNSDLFLREEEIDDLAVALQRELFSRHYGHVVRLEIDINCPETIVDFLLQKHHLHHEDAYYCDGPVNLQRYFYAINRIDRPDLNYPLFNVQYPFLHHTRNLFSFLDEQNILLHHPYQSFEIVIDFLRQAAADPNVLAIKQTLYRVHSESAMVKALVEAARSGKEVTAVVELRARFDEESNLKLANRLHEGGVLVLYGVVGYKTHAKMTLVVRRMHGKLKQYVHLGTGNYHEQTAKKYTDFGLLTSDPTITADTQIIFQQLTGLGRVLKLKALSHAPFTLQRHLLTHIEECTETAIQGKKARINIKVNGLTDKVIIKALYCASQAGVKINLIVRSLCCLRPGIPGVSENIRVISVLGRFLEHHRVYYFQADKKEYYYCSSADLMERNLYNRIEILFPILDEVFCKRIQHEIFNNYLQSNRHTWEMQADGSYKGLLQGEHDAQEKLIEVYSSTD